MTYSYLKVDVPGAVATVTLNRPDRRNAFDDKLIAEITDAFTGLNADDAVRAIIIRGEGKSFSAGADLEWMGRMAAYTREENLADAARAQAMFESIAASPKATVAAVHGAALGGGAGLAACCDIAIAVKGALLAFSEVRLGIAPSIIGPYVINKIGPGHARALFVTGRRLDADEALRIGLVQQVVDAEQLDRAVESTVAEVLQSGPLAIAAIKKLMRDLQGQAAVDAARAMTVELIADLRVSAEGQEGLKAFLEKRKPNFAE
jgi:methylglutaconyl-CoA hydratase